MTPNLFIATQTLFSPHKWFKNSSRAERPTRRTEQWEDPVPGEYEYIPGRGWYCVATFKDVSTNTTTLLPKDGGPVKGMEDVKTREMIKMTPPVPVRYSKVLKKYLLAPDYEMRKRYGRIPDERGKMVEVGFFRLDDGIAWVQCWDDHGEFVPGPYKLWCIDPRTHQFRHMLKGDHPEYRSQSNSQTTSLAASRQNSFDRGHDSPARRSSQESRSTQFRSGPGSTRDGPSVPSTRANSIKGLTPSNPSSQPASQANSRRSSPKRSPLIQGHFPNLDEAKAALREVAKEQAAAQSRADIQEAPRGRAVERANAPVN